MKLDRERLRFGHLVLQLRCIRRRLDRPRERLLKFSDNCIQRRNITLTMRRRRGDLSLVREAMGV